MPTTTPARRASVADNTSEGTKTRTLATEKSRRRWWVFAADGQRTLVALNSRRFEAAVELIRALGGGWDGRLDGPPVTNQQAGGFQ